MRIERNPRRRAQVAALALCLGASGCFATRGHVDHPTADVHPVSLAVDVFLPEARPAGLSGLAVDGDDLWLVPERDRELLVCSYGDGIAESSADGGEDTCRRVRVESVPDGVDLESATFIGPNLLAAGTESRNGAVSIRVLRIDGDRAIAEEEIGVPHSLWGIDPRPNRGAEGLCRAGGSWVVALERRMRGPSGSAFDATDALTHAPIGVYDPETGRWRAHTVRLTSETGRLSGLDCRVRDGTIRTVAIERSLSTRRLIAFDIEPNRPTIDAREVFDLGREGPFAGMNPEGVAWIGDKHAVVVTDNAWGNREKVETVVVRLFGVFAALEE